MGQRGSKNKHQRGESVIKQHDQKQGNQTTTENVSDDNYENVRCND